VSVGFLSSLIGPPATVAVGAPRGIAVPRTALEEGK
jgi:hypothetical protein